MKDLKMFGLAAVATAALMAFIGAGTASARICSTGTIPCTSAWATNTIMEFSLKSGGSAKLTDTSGNTLDTCISSNIGGFLTSNPSGGTPASMGSSSLSLLGCTVTTHTIVPGGLKFFSGSGGSGAVRADSRSEVTVNVFSSCNYGVSIETALGTISEGAGTSSVLKINAVTKKLAGGFLCPETTKWMAEYVLTSPWSTTFYASSS